MKQILLFFLLPAFAISATQFQDMLSEYRTLYYESISSLENLQWQDQNTPRSSDAVAGMLEQKGQELVEFISANNGNFEVLKDFLRETSASNLGYLKTPLENLIVKLATSDFPDKFNKIAFLRSSLKKIDVSAVDGRYLPPVEQEKFVNMIKALYGLADRSFMPKKRGKDATEYFAAVSAVWNNLSPETQSNIIALQKGNTYRLTREGNTVEIQEFQYTTENFVINYTIGGRHSIFQPDVTEKAPDGKNYPKYAVTVGKCLENSLNVLRNTLVMKSPKLPYTVYLKELGEQNYGATTPDFSVPGEDKYYTTFMEIENDFAGNYTDNDLQDKQLGRIEVTAAHELFHASCAMYGGFKFNSPLWFAESTAVWAEDFFYTEVNDYIHYLQETDSPFLNPHYGLIKYSYGGCVFDRFLSEQRGAAAVRKLWEQFAVDHDPVTALANSIGENFKIFFGDYVTALYLKDEKFTEGKRYPAMFPTNKFSSYPVNYQFQVGQPNYLGASYVLFEPVRVKTLNLKWSSIYKYPVKIILISRNGSSSVEQKSGTGWSVAIPEFGKNVVKLIIAPYRLDAEVENGDFQIQAELN
ncbi:MAG: hypothetical protein PHW04_07680 [Candidatus Wallbacteria bacterium]|nr:hypothetical protein [Candidatus Wallbacteria bacterium]